MILCHCAVVSDREVRDAIHAGATDVCSIAAACGTSQRCGGCLPAIRDQLRGHGLPTDDGLDAAAVRAALRTRTSVAATRAVAS